MTTPLVTIGADRFAFDAMIEMLETECTTCRSWIARARWSGSCLRAISPIWKAGVPSPSGRPSQARDEEALVRAAGLPALLIGLIDAGLSAPEIGRVLSLQNDTATARLVDFAMERLPGGGLGTAGLGSVARRELTWPRTRTMRWRTPTAATRRRRQLLRARDRARERRLARCGFGIDAGDVLARITRRMSASAWIRVFQECLESPGPSQLVRAAVSFDFRHVMGGSRSFPHWSASCRRPAGIPIFSRLARTATDQRPPLDFLGRISVRKGSGTQGRIDLKQGGIVPIASLARFHACRWDHDLGDTRSSGGRRGGRWPRWGDRTVAAGGVHIVCDIRIKHHVACITRRRAPTISSTPTRCTRWSGRRCVGLPCRHAGTEATGPVRSARTLSRRKGPERGDSSQHLPRPAAASRAHGATPRTPDSRAVRASAPPARPARGPLHLARAVQVPQTMVGRPSSSHACSTSRRGSGRHPKNGYTAAGGVCVTRMPVLPRPDGRRARR
jgi:hypothetical protein